MTIEAASLASRFDHTCLSLGGNANDIYKLCTEAKEHGFYSVMVYPTYVCECRMLLEGSDVKIGTVVGFPHGCSDTEVKEAEIVLAARQGADEVDIVINHQLLRSGHEEATEDEIRRLTDTAKLENLTVKFIVETAYLTDSEKIKTLYMCEKAAADFIKTSTGFAHEGALLEDIQLLNRERSNIKIKASGGIKTLEKASKFINAGADRLGASAGVKIMQEFYERYRGSNILSLPLGNNNENS